MQRLEEEEKVKEKKKNDLAKQKATKAAKANRGCSGKGRGKATSPKVAATRKSRVKRIGTTSPRKPKQHIPAQPANTSGSSDSEDTGVCEECSGVYAADDKAAKEKWMGCDNCDRWFHYDCLGLYAIPAGFWSCDQC